MESKTMEANTNTKRHAPEGAKVHHATATKAEKLAALLLAEYPALTLVAKTNEDASQIVGWEVEAKQDDEIHVVYDDKPVPAIADLLDACDELGIDPEAGQEDEEPKASGSVVQDHYRAQYREQSSNKQTCGDWLAEQLVSDTHGPEGFMVDDFTAILSANGVDMRAKWAQLPFSGQKGWVGRYRMNGRQVLEKLVALNGIYIDLTGTRIVPDAAFLTTMRTKHGKWIAKQEKLIKLADDAAAEMAKEDAA
jgi:hypothetical protein